MAQSPVYRERTVKTYDRGKTDSASVPVVLEIPITVYVNDTEMATLICSPGGHKELAVGFLLSEGLLQGLADIKDITFNEQDGLLWVETAEPAPQLKNFLRRQIASCCGKGRAALYYINDARNLKPVQSSCVFAASHLLHVIGLLEERSDTFHKTGGVHSAAMADNKGMLVMYEDIGRHNAVDKVMGYAFLNRLNPSDKCLLLSGRISSEILIKAAHNGIPVVVSRSAPTFLAVELADEFNITLVGFARGERLTVYSHTERVSM
ncbi:MAG TPA: formate dehydrogenase accessory sulfurtransferase FdhD [Pelotomaculum sp.]|nr:formate dehydrogenase accessory sulfurtransferase FdhD [Pelotomaculum sp.]